MVKTGFLMTWLNFQWIYCVIKVVQPTDNFLKEVSSGVHVQQSNLKAFKIQVWLPGLLFKEKGYKKLQTACMYVNKYFYWQELMEFDKQLFRLFSGLGWDVIHLWYVREQYSQDCYLAFILLYLKFTIKILKIWMPKKNAVIALKSEQGRLYCKVMYP